jgi:hypothetical protein
MISEAPMTPPLSPRPLDDKEEVMDAAIVADTDRPCVPLDEGLVHSNVTPVASNWKEIEETEMTPPSPTPLSPPPQSTRLLEDEESHVERSGLLRLGDFQVKGVLGQSFSVSPFGGLFLIPIA